SAEIARQIADRLLKSGLAAVVRPVAPIDSVERYRAVILGSAGHDRQWRPELAQFLRRFSDELSHVPVWLFSTGSSNETRDHFDPRVSESVPGAGPESALVARARDVIVFRNHRRFAGEFQRSGWSLLGDLFLKVCGGSNPDDRDWRDINEWADRIARELQAIDHVRERRRLHLSVRGRP
ncbi:MAG TPA: flavodoxin domain-containing protein, partial [Polyangiaceae bacterium]